MMETVSKRLLLSGRVQGVGFRYFTRRTAGELGVTGWVRNRKDGCVECVVQGSRETVDEMIGRMKQGPPSARVEDLKVEELTGGPEDFASFEVRYSV